MDKKEWFDLDRGLWLFLTDLTHWISERDLKEAINTLKTQVRILEDFQTRIMLEPKEPKG